MNGVLRPDPANVIMIGLIAFVLVFGIDRGLRAIGKNTWTTSGT
jgi:hypothetical protein